MNTSMHTCSLNHYSNMKNATIITTPIYLSKNNNINAKQVKDTEANNCCRALKPRHNEDGQQGKKHKCKIM